jgi:tetratricopeptide (TPR) repeat protein
VRVNIASALTERYDRGRDVADPRRALVLFDAAISELRASGARSGIALHNQGLALRALATAEGGTEVHHLDRALAVVGDALRCPEPGADERAEYLNTLGLVLRAKGLAEADPALLRESDEAYREARRCADPGGDNHTAATLNLASVLQDRAEAENEANLLREAVNLYRSLLVTAVDEQRRLSLAAYHATALANLYRYSRDRTVLSDAIADLRHAVEAMRTPGVATPCCRTSRRRCTRCTSTPVTSLYWTRRSLYRRSCRPHRIPTSPGVRSTSQWVCSGNSGAGVIEWIWSER